MYRVQANNFSLAFYAGEKHGTHHYIGLRKKFDLEYLDAEYDGDANEGTCWPYQLLEACHLPEKFWTITVPTGPDPANPSRWVPNRQLEYYLRQAAEQYGHE